MRIKSLKISNFRAIENFEVGDLGDFIVIAGANGCGKTTVLDALRLLKSVYVKDEWNRWFGEFGLDLNQPTYFYKLLRDRNLPASIEATFEISRTERDFLQRSAYNIALSLALANEGIQSATITGDRPLFPPAISAEKKTAVEAEAGKDAEQITDALDKGSEFVAALTLTSEPNISVNLSPVAFAAFSCFNPKEIGEIELHGSRRIYVRESVSNLRLKVKDRDEERRSRFLYDLENKYRNIKTHLGEEYISSILRREDPNEAPLQKSLKELFRTFFPGKTFLGVGFSDDNSMTFDVQLDTGETHDIDEMSSGEKEIVYGYLWLRTGTPKKSVVLIDEPELHLNPALVQGLPSFYKTNLAEALEAQIWIITHSDAILRQAVRSPQMVVYHMARPRGDQTQQAVRIDNQDGVEAAVLDLVGDLAAYRPYAKIILLEGHKDTRFDVDMIRRLFPDIVEKANFIPVGNRTMTSGVRSRLLEVLTESGLSARAASISDGDLNLLEIPEEIEGQHFKWPAYEVENFLISPDILRGACVAMLGQDRLGSDAKIAERLRRVAGKLVGVLAKDETQHALNQEFVRSIGIGASNRNPLRELVKSASSSQKKIAELDVSVERVTDLFDRAASKFSRYLESDEFLVRFPGDRLLRAFAGDLGMNGDHFRNACVDQAQKLNFRPFGMEETLKAALT